MLARSLSVLLLAMLLLVPLVPTLEGEISEKTPSVASSETGLVERSSLPSNGVSPVVEPVAGSWATAGPSTTVELLYDSFDPLLQGGPSVSNLLSAPDNSSVFLLQVHLALGLEFDRRLEH